MALGLVRQIPRLRRHLAVLRFVAAVVVVQAVDIPPHRQAPWQALAVCPARIPLVAVARRVLTAVLALLVVMVPQVARPTQPKVATGAEAEAQQPLAARQVVMEVLAALAVAVEVVAVLAKTPALAATAGLAAQATALSTPGDDCPFHGAYGMKLALQMVGLMKLSSQLVGGMLICWMLQLLGASLPRWRGRKIMMLRLSQLLLQTKRHWLGQKLTTLLRSVLMLPQSQSMPPWRGQRITMVVKLSYCLPLAGLLATAQCLSGLSQRARKRLQKPSKNRMLSLCSQSQVQHSSRLYER